ncbi:MAG: DNA polymerase IV [Lachnospiraceae bacterium]|nr:DNA polymerase IV [Lachnospiraceae bacterium]
MSERCIFHVDVNSAFLSWSAVKRLKDDPDSVDLRTIPSAVGGDVETRHGIITARSIPAKKFGIKTAEPVVKALQKCPELVLIKSDFKTYREYSHEFIKILRKHAPVVQQASIDEAYLDFTGTKAASDPLKKAEAIRDEIRDSLGFTVNVGISVNKLLAKMASDFEKPDKIHTLYPYEIEKKMWPLPIGDLYGCGKRTASKLENYGIRTIGDAAVTPLEVLVSILGESAGAYIYESSNGVSDSQVSEEERDAKSYSNESTTSIDIDENNFEAVGLPIVHGLAASVAGRLKRDGVYAGTIEASVKTDDFKRRSHQRRLVNSTNDENLIEKTAIGLLEEMLKGNEGLFSKGYKVRLIGVGGTNLDRQEYQQMSLFDLMKGNSISLGEEKVEPDEGEIRREKLRKMMNDIKTRYGEDAVFKGRKK